MIYGIIDSFLRAQRTGRVLLLQVEFVVKFPTGVCSTEGPGPPLHLLLIRLCQKPFLFSVQST